MNRNPYIQKQPSNWWVKNPFYRMYMLREGTAVPLLIYTFVLIAGVYSLTQGQEAFDGWVDSMRSPVMVIFHLICLASAMLHTVTWFELVPKILVIRKGGKPVPGELVKKAHWGAFVVLNLLVIIFAGALL